MSKKRIFSNISLLLLLIVYILFYKFYLFDKMLKYAEVISAAFMLLLMFVAIFLLGFKKDKATRFKRNIISMTITNIILFFAISYGIGLVVGFLKNSYSLTLPSIFENAFPPIVIIIGSELFRYVYINANKDKKVFIILLTIFLTLFELVISVRTINFNDFGEAFKVITSTVLPIISKNVVLSYLCYHVGYIPGLVYRLVMDVYVFIMPIIPDLGDYINSMIGIALPIIIYTYASRYIDEYNKDKSLEFYKKETFKLSDIPFLIVIVLLICLISGYFPYYITGIGSGSMEPAIKKGDAVIINKVDSPDDIKEGDVIAFGHDGKTIVHRLVKIEKVNGVVYYRTKGDANNSIDNINLTIKNIEGKVKFKIPYIAIPTIYVSEFLKGDSK